MLGGWSCLRRPCGRAGRRGRSRAVSGGGGGGGGAWQAASGVGYRLPQLPSDKRYLRSSATGLAAPTRNIAGPGWDPPLGLAGGWCEVVVRLVVARQTGPTTRRRESRHGPGSIYWNRTGCLRLASHRLHSVVFPYPVWTGSRLGLP